MKNNYLIVCNDHCLIKDKINKLIDNFYKDAAISNYDLEENELSEVLEDLDTYGLFSNKKVIIVRNVFIDHKDKLFDKLIKYIDNYNQDNLLIMIEEKLDNRVNIVKQIKENKNIELITLKVDSMKYIKELLRDYKIDNNSIELLSSLCKDDISKINNECNKLKMYKIDDKIITYEDIKSLVVEKIGESDKLLFSLIDYIISKDKRESLLTLEKLKKYNLDSNSIIGLMSSQIRLLHQVKVLDEIGYQDIDIKNELKLKSSYQVKKMKEYIYNYSYLSIHKIVKLLAEFDYKIKSGRIDSNIAIEMLIINS